MTACYDTGDLGMRNLTVTGALQLSGVRVGEVMGLTPQHRHSDRHRSCVAASRTQPQPVGLTTKTPAHGSTWGAECGLSQWGRSGGGCIRGCVRP